MLPAGNRFFGFTDRSPFYLKPGSKITQGNVGNASSSGTFVRFSIELYFTMAFKIETLFWDIAAVAPYYIQQVDGIGASPNVIKTFSVAGPFLTNGTVVVPINPPLYFAPTEYAYFSIAQTGGTAYAQRRQSTSVPITFTGFNNTRVGYDGSATTTGSMPVRIVGNYWELKKR